jgi:hypothetical protein
MRLCVVVLIFTCVAYTYADTGVPYSRTGTLLTSFTVPLTLQEANLGSETCRNNCSVASGTDIITNCCVDYWFSKTPYLQWRTRVPVLPNAPLSACRAWSYFRNETICAPPGQRGLCRMFTTIGGTTSDPCSLSGVNGAMLFLHVGVRFSPPNSLLHSSDGISIPFSQELTHTPLQLP